jgi:CHAT domain-containing protein
MVKFYEFYVKGGMTKIEALRQAQLSLLNGLGQDNSTLNDVKNTFKAEEQKPLALPNTKPNAEPRRDTSELADVNQKEASPYPIDATKPYAHPYYWAPFVLFGNWR